MALDGLRQEFPEASALARRAPSPRIARASLGWAVLAAFGAALFVSAPLTTVLGLLGLMGGGALVTPSQLIGALAAGAAFAVAWVAGGRAAAIAYAVFVLLERLLALPGLMTFCARAGFASDTCAVPSYILAFWPLVLGVGVAYLLVRWVRRSDGDRNQLLEPAGALTLTQALLGGLFAALLVSATSFESGLAFLVAAIAAGIACGLVLLRRVPPPRRWPVLGVIALLVVGPWLLVSVPQFMGQVGIGGGLAIGGLGLIGFAAPVVQLGAAATVLYMAAARAVAAET